LPIEEDPVLFELGMELFAVGLAPHLKARRTTQAAPRPQRLPPPNSLQLFGTGRRNTGAPGALSA